MIIARSAKSAATKADLATMGCVVTIGNFDGLHLGHQMMLRIARKEADAQGVPLVVMSFDPHPADYFSPTSAPGRIDNFGQRVISLQRYGVDVACIVPFNTALAEMTHEKYVAHILHDKLNAKCVVIGDDFQYGKDRAGNIDTLSAMGNALGFEVKQINTILQGKQRVSSTALRASLESGDFDAVEIMLGHRYCMSGRVLHGDKRGRSWGFPTLNLSVQQRVALRGVFAVKVRGLNEQAISGVANLGTRPTVDGVKTLLEVHLFDFDRQVYGQRICVDFYTRIRQEQKFESFEALKAQIGRDIEYAKHYFNHHKA